MAVITLPEVPQGEDLEDYVAAFLQCGGFYTDISLVERGEAEVLELDIMAWKPHDKPPRHTLFEIKGGNWGFADVFKVYGWKTYLNPRGVDTAYVVAPRRGRSGEVVDYTREKCAEIGLALIVHDDLPMLEANLKDLGLIPSETNQLDHSMWRFAFWLERQMQRVVTTSRRTLREHQGPNEIYAYQEAIRNGFLQARDVRERLASLYDAHFGHQVLAKSVAFELDHMRWDPSDPADGSHWREALRNCKHPLVQAAMYYQHRAKLDILKGAVEFALLTKHGELPPERTIKFLGIEAPANFLPSSFHNAVQELQSIESFEKVAILWQSFLWKWGGFFVVDHEADEKSALADEVGMTPKAVDAAMGIFDSLFPIPDGWFINIQGTKLLKLFPCQFRGIGARYRCARLGASEPKEAFGSLPYQYLVSNLARWNNSAVALLQYGTPSGELTGS